MSATTITTTTHAEAAPATGLAFELDLLLRDRATLVARIVEGCDTRALIKALLLTIALGAGAFGAVLGAHRGGLQTLFAGIKLPLVVLGTAAICAPALSAINGAMGRPFDLRKDLAIVLVALATGCLALAAMAPLVLFAQMWGLAYHQLILVTVGSCAVAGAFGFVPLLTGLWRSGRESVVWTLGALFLVFALVGSQMAWTLRPYLLRPRTEEIPFVRQVEGSFLDAVFVSMDSAAGHYTRPEAPLPGDHPFGRSR